MNTKNKEQIAVAELTRALSRLDYVSTDFNQNDKTPSWDGFIFLYKSKSDLKSELIKRIPVQIKGHYQKPPYAREINYSFEVADLNNYFNDTGVILFAVYVDDSGNSAIYYNDLTKYKLRNILKDKTNNKSVSIHLKEFPRDREEAVDIFFMFANNMKITIPDKEITIYDIANGKIPGYDSFQMSYSGIQYKDDPIGYFLNHKITLTAKSSYTGVVLPVSGDVSIEFFSKKNKEPISIEHKNFYDSYSLIRKKDNVYILKFGKSFSFFFQKTGKEIHSSFKFKIQGNLSERIVDTKFLLAFISNKTITFGDKTLRFPIDKETLDKIDIKYYEFNLRFLELTDQLLKKLHVNEILDYNKVTEKDEEALIILINSILFSGKYINPELKESTFFNIRIANITLLIFALKCDDNKFIFYDFFDPQNTLVFAADFDHKDEKFLVPNVFFLNKNAFIGLDNIDYTKILNEIKKSQTSDSLKRFTYHYLDEMIQGYQNRKKEKSALRNCIISALNYLITVDTGFNYEELKKKFN